MYHMSRMKMQIVFIGLHDKLQVNYTIQMTNLSRQ
jgi:hypothetical protein